LQNVALLNEMHGGFKFWREEAVGARAGNGFT
jgi:hypothetical protein